MHRAQPDDFKEEKAKIRDKERKDLFSRVGRNVGTY
jgi:hypothetical protein